jgi:peptidoglycan/LPS O-acetylase OafA/YrhL
MPDRTGDKMDTTGLGLATIGLSLVVGVALWRLLRAAMLWVRAVCPVVALACVVACFTTVGRLWYVPGPLLIVAAVCAFLTAPAVRQADPNGQRGGRQSRGRGDGRAGS